MIFTEYVLMMSTLAPFVPTPAICINAALKLLKMENSRIFYDLGGGDGRVSFAALSVSPKTLVRCVESDHRLCNIARKDFKRYCRLNRVSQSDQSRFELLEQDIVDTNFGDASHIYTYLTEEGIENISHTLNTKLMHGTRLLSVEYPIPNWTILESQHIMGLTLYLYEFDRHSPTF
eukprot:1040573_1